MAARKTSRTSTTKAPRRAKAATKTAKAAPKGKAAKGKGKPAASRKAGNGKASKAKAPSKPQKAHCIATDPFGAPCQSIPRYGSKHCTIHSYLDRH